MSGLDKERPRKEDSAILIKFSLELGRKLVGGDWIHSLEGTFKIHGTGTLSSTPPFRHDPEDLSLFKHYFTRTNKSMRPFLTQLKQRRHENNYFLFQPK